MNDKQSLKRGILKLLISFFLIIVLIVLWVLLITETVGTTLGDVILIVFGIAMIIVGSIVLVSAIRDLIKAIRS